ncbi:MAG: hypothetical protein EPO35_04020, partial [Acidobacteria bacterium]
MRRSTLAFLLAAAVSTNAQQPQKDSAVIGVVIDAATGAPIAGAIVTLRPSNPDLRVPLDSVTERAITTNDGEFVFGPIGAASYNLSASGAGYLGSGNGRQRPDGPTQPVNVGEREVVDGLTIKMWRTAVVGGTVTDEFGEPVVGCLVNVVRRTWAAGRPRFEVVGTPATDDRGVYRIANLTPGEYAAFVPGMR